MIIGIDASPAARREKTGVEWYTWHLLKQFARLDHENQYRLYTSLPFEGEDRALLSKNFQEKVLPSPTKWFWPQTRFTWELLRHKPDRLFVPADAMPLVHPVHTITTIHDIGFIPFKNIYEWKRQQYLYWTTWHATKTAHKIMTVSEFTKSEIIKYYRVAPERIVVTHLGYDEDVYTPTDQNNCIADNQILLNLGLSGIPYILTIAPLERKKNLTTLIKAFALLKKQYPDLKLVIVGKERLAKNEILEEIAQNPYTQDIIHRGWVSQEEKVALLRNAHVFAFPSLYEGFGLPIVEAQSCQVPVVASRAASLPEIGGDGALYHETTSVEDLANKIFIAATDEAVRADLIAKGKANITRFSWEQCAKKTLEGMLED